MTEEMCNGYRIHILCFSRLLVGTQRHDYFNSLGVTNTIAFSPSFDGGTRMKLYLARFIYRLICCIAIVGIGCG
jgi:hypothetical protein